MKNQDVNNQVSPASDTEEQPNTVIDITGIDKALILMALFNSAPSTKQKSFATSSNVSTSGFGEPITYEQANKLLEGNTHFRYILDRFLDVDLSGTELDVSGYNKLYGKESAEIVLEELIPNLKPTSNPHQDPNQVLDYIHSKYINSGLFDRIQMAMKYAQRHCTVNAEFIQLLLDKDYERTDLECRLVFLSLESLYALLYYAKDKPAPILAELLHPSYEYYLEDYITKVLTGQLGRRLYANVMTFSAHNPEPIILSMLDDNEKIASIMQLYLLKQFKKGFHNLCAFLATSNATPVQIENFIHVALNTAPKHDSKWVQKSLNQLYVQPSYNIVKAMDAAIKACRSGFNSNNQEQKAARLTAIKNQYSISQNEADVLEFMREAATPRIGTLFGRELSFFTAKPKNTRSYKAFMKNLSDDNCRKFDGLDVEINGINRV